MVLILRFYFIAHRTFNNKRIHSYFPFCSEGQNIKSFCANIGVLLRLFL